MQALLNQPELVITAFLSLFAVFLVTVFIIAGRHKNKIALLEAQYLLEKAGLEEKLVGLTASSDQNFTNWQQEQERANQLRIKYSALQTRLTERELSYQQQLASLQEAKTELKKEFSLLANQIFEEKGQAFKSLNQESVTNLLKPMQEELRGFKQKVETIHTEELKQAITSQAEQLTTALQGQKKTQGNWGELMLENVLESAGLRVGDDYQREFHVKTLEGNYRPDVVVFLPQNRHLVIDAKTSLNAYTQYVNADNELIAEQALKQHVMAVNARIEELASKGYDKFPGLNSPEVVILFMPIESAYVEALKYQPDLYQRAIEKNILVATPTTLLTSMNIVRQLWRFEEQSKHSAELAQRAERFYTKLNGFLTSMQGVGKTLDKAKEGYDRAFAQLYSGKGNLIKQAAEFKELGVAVQKELPKELIEKAELELNFEQSEEV
ncbi:DNA recombination protein RmuC [Pseudoalteromonas sp. G4]|uniref:DNA recombination protein RmuC n=1 Tax=Pseudoalteromonas sp. G4 TaxID=2992761 RepID=UPI00237D66CD|nr:DNA recombination protein RmuC [Pseudoalteromonas sp. G4]MDE3270956.1 DNA recombination protein RmuC [Pseudoalteromonas sp. G4]